MTPQTSSRSSAVSTVLKLSTLTILAAVMLVLGRVAWVYNLERACTLRQWPELPSCTDRANDVPSQIQRLLQRIARNPGDSEAAIQLAMLANQQGQLQSVNPDAALDTATRLAGEDYRVQRMQAVRAIQLKQWPKAVDWLTRLVQDSSDGPAAITLAALVREPKAFSAMQAHIKPGASWLEPLVGAMPQARVPVVLAMPLVARALQLQGLSPELTQRLLQQLKADGQWLEAHALWTAWLGRPSDLIFNGNFDQGFIVGGFDWEVTPVSPSKAGALVQQLAMARHGGVLQVEFTGRPIVVPVIRQPLVLLHTRFVFTGQFMANKLRSNEGLAWVFQCAATGREVARTSALKDTAGEWRPLTVELDIPTDCGQAVVLQLQTFAAYEATTGLRGDITFDNFRLETRP